MSILSPKFEKNQILKITFKELITFTSIHKAPVKSEKDLYPQTENWIKNMNKQVTKHKIGKYHENNINITNI